jgi:FkbH-like protein
MQHSGDQRCLTVEVNDRFGDYGLVGVIIYTINYGYLDVNTFMLSCRALGRRVEKKMLSRIKEEAIAEGCKEVRIHFVKTNRNQPAYEFLEEVGADYKEPIEGGWIFRLPLELILSNFDLSERAGICAHPKH